MRLETSGKNFARYSFGDLTVIALLDGYVDMDRTLLRQGNGEAFEEMPPEIPLHAGKLRLSVNAFLVIDKDLHVLVDTGAANAWEPTMGLLPEALAEAGVAPENITIVALTHTHADHVNGLVAPDGSEAFSNATRILVAREEMPTFEKKERLVRLKGRIVPIDDGQAVSNRIMVVKAAGHSPGHTSYEVLSGDSRLLIWGDIVHVPSAQFAQPELTWQYDADQPQAMDTRIKLLEHVAQPNYYVAGAHLDFPGIGRVRKKGAHYAFKALGEA